MTRKWEPREMRMVAEYLAERYPMYRSATRVRLGAVHPELLEGLEEAEKRLVESRFRRWADAIVIAPHEIILIEGAILPDPGDISKLILYRELLKITPEFQPYMELPVRMELIVAIEDPVLVRMARQNGIVVIHYAPEWIREYIKSLPRRKQRPPHTYLPE